jgi:hypothetical protein
MVHTLHNEEAFDQYILKLAVLIQKL